MEMNKKTSFDKTIFELDTGNAESLVLSSELKNNLFAVNKQNTVRSVETMNKKTEKYDDEAPLTACIFVNIAWNK